MIAAGHQPNYLPYAGFFHKMLNCDIFVIVDEVQFIKKGPLGWINRNKIRTPSGWQWLTVPVRSKYKQKINEVLIDNSQNWAKDHMKAIWWNYKTAPFFEKYKDAIFEAYYKKWEYLCELNIFLIRRLAEILGIKTPIRRQSEDGINGKATGLIIDICRKTGADTYLSGIHGRDYLDQQMIKDNNINLIFQQFTHPVYKQCHKGEFIENMSVIDLIFNCGEESRSLLSGK